MIQNEVYNYNYCIIFVEILIKRKILSIFCMFLKINDQILESKVKIIL